MGAFGSKEGLLLNLWKSEIATRYLIKFLDFCLQKLQIKSTFYASIKTQTKSLKWWKIKLFIHDFSFIPGDSMMGVSRQWTLVVAWVLSCPHVDNNEEQFSKYGMMLHLCFVLWLSVACVVWVLLTKCNDMINVGSA